MSQVFRTVSHRLPVLALAVLCVAFTAQGQSRDARIISARAGGVNYVSGSVSVKLKGETVWNALTTKENLESGDTVKTGAGGRVEVLLNPGSYMRVGENAEFELADASLDALRVKLLSGSAVIEATGYDDMAILIAVDTPHTQVSIIRSGIYRINASASGSDVAVQKGRALVGMDQATILKGGKTAHFGGGAVEVAKFDKNSKDALDAWSKERGKELASLNRGLSARTLNPVLASMGFDNFGSFTSGNNRNGVWIYNSRTCSYTFLPFSFGWTSPYGGFYDSSIVGPFNYPCSSCQHNRNGMSGGIVSGGITAYPTPGGGSGNGGTFTNPTPAPTQQNMPPIRDIPTPRPPNVEQRIAGPSVNTPRDH